MLLAVQLTPWNKCPNYINYQFVGRNILGAGFRAEETFSQV